MLNNKKTIFINVVILFLGFIIGYIYATNKQYQDVNQNLLKQGQEKQNIQNENSLSQNIQNDKNIIQEKSQSQSILKTVTNKTIKGFLNLGINFLSENKISSALIGISNISRSDLSNINDIKGFTKQVLDVATEGILIPDGSAKYKIDDSYSLSFNKSTDPTNTNNKFNEAEYAIYAHFNISSKQHPKIFVKWVSLDQNKLINFNSYSIADSSNNYVWLFYPWQKGTYQVSIFSFSDNLTLLARANFVVK